jgi:hypothetical protein
MSENKRPKRIYNVDVVRSLVKPAPSLEKFKEANPHIFDHLSKEDEDAAYTELYEEYKTPVANPKPSGQTPGQSAQS